MSKYTPGPWTWGYDSINRNAMPRLFSWAGEVCNFGDCTRYYPTEGTPPNLPDSHLIVAAPELLEVVQKLIDASNENAGVVAFSCAVDEFIEQARGVLAKAKGEQA